MRERVREGERGEGTEGGGRKGRREGEGGREGRNEGGLKRGRTRMKGEGDRDRLRKAAM